jgi:hypothetical protein
VKNNICHLMRNNVPIFKFKCNKKDVILNLIFRLHFEIMLKTIGGYDA